MRYEINGGSVSLGGKRILDHICFQIKGQEKVALVGPNGAGKTTLLRLICGELETDRDDFAEGPVVTSARSFTIGMLSQVMPERGELTLGQLLSEDDPYKDELSRERFAWEAEVTRLLLGLGFSKEDRQKRLSEFSGGEQTKLSLLRLLLQKPELLLLDEPTNHLDLRSVEWLEKEICNYPGAVVMVSHDRFFLDRTAQIVVELENGHLTRYTGGYTAYREQKKKDRAAQRKAYEAQQAELRRLNELIERFKTKPSKAAFARSRKKIIERMELLPEPPAENGFAFSAPITPNVPGNKLVLETEDLAVGYDRVLFPIELRVRRGQKIAVIGENGVGKTALLKTLAGLISPKAGKIRMGDHVEMGYFDQQTAAQVSPLSVEEHFTERFASLDKKTVRDVLGHFLFRGKDVMAAVNTLSGGERSRLYLCELIQAGPNLMLLDEPTNHMDITAKETLESAFRAYTGTMLFVSHDRYFLREVADALLIVGKNEVRYHPFGYEHYCMVKDRPVNASITAEEEAMRESFRAVPRREYHESKPLTTEEAFLDWKRGLLSEEMEKAAVLWEELIDRQERGREAAIARELGYDWDFEDETEDLTEAIRKAEENWTNLCIDWETA